MKPIILSLCICSSLAACKGIKPADVEPEPVNVEQAETILHDDIRNKTQGVWLVLPNGVPAFCVRTPNDETCSTMPPTILKMLMDSVGIPI